MSKSKAQNFSAELENNPKELVKYLDLALEGANLGIWDWYLADNSVKFDRRWAEMLGLDYASLKMELSTWESRVHPDDLEKCYADIKAYMDGKTDYYENIHRMKHAEGHWVYILDRGRFSDWDENGKPTRFTGTHFDITTSERYRNKLSILFESSPFGYAFCDMDGNLLEINSRYAEIIGYNFEELKKLSYWEITPKKYEEDEAKQLQSMKDTGRYGPYRKEYIRKDGSTVPVELNGFIVEDYDGVKGIWSTVEDISEKQMLESQLMHSSKLASIGVLAAGVGHEINNPLAIIKALNEKLERENFDNAELLNTTKRIDGAIDRIAKIVAGLRTFSRSDSKVSKNIDVLHTIQNSISMVEDIFSSEGINLELNANGEKQFIVNGNEGRLHQVFVNLLANAKDATKENEIREVSIAIETQAEEVNISVKDNGTGIAKENLSKVFDPFFTTKDVNEGTGIGLSVAYNIVEEHGGKILALSSPETGTEFKVILPLSLANSKDIVEPIKSRSKDFQKLERSSLSGAILLVEDESEFRELIKESLESMGLSVVAVENGKQAFSKYKENPANFDVIVSDMKMPVMDGPDLFKKIRALSVNQPKFVFITGEVDRDLRDYEGISELAVDGCFYKPFSQDEIFATLSRILSELKDEKVA